MHYSDWSSIADQLGEEWNTDPTHRKVNFTNIDTPGQKELFKTPDKTESELVDALSSGSMSPADIRRVLSVSQAARAPSVQAPSTPQPGNDVVVIDGKQYKLMMSKIRYKVSQASRANSMSLVDRGANGGLAGGDVCVLERSPRSVDIDNHQVTGLPIVTAAAKVETTSGPVILLLHQYAYLGQGKTIHSSGQMEHYEIDVCDKSKKVANGKQRIKTLEGPSFLSPSRMGYPTWNYILPQMKSC